jgi:hypothetical protein
VPYDSSENGFHFHGVSEEVIIDLGERGFCQSGVYVEVVHEHCTVAPEFVKQVLPTAKLRYFDGGRFVLKNSLERNAQ